MSALAILVATSLLAPVSSKADKPVADDVYVTVLSDMVASNARSTPPRSTHAEWGFAALVEVKTSGRWHQLLFDSGADPATVLYNASRLTDRKGGLGIDLCGVEDLVLSHNHGDHTSGFVAIRRACLAKDPKSRALINAYVGGEEIFWPRLQDNGHDRNGMPAHRTAFEALGGHFIIATSDGRPMPIAGVPGAWTTGKIPRTFDEKTYPGTPAVTNPHDATRAVDVVPEEHALVINTAKGLVVITGCAHAGVVNTVTYASRLFSDAPVYGFLGGFHLISARHGRADEVATIEWTAEHLKTDTEHHRDFGITYLLGAHCTGSRPLQFLQARLGLDDQHAATSTVDTRFSLGEGLIFQALNRPIP